MIFLAWFDHLEQSFSYKEVQFETFCSSVKTSCPPAENFNETPAYMYPCYVINAHFCWLILNVIFELFLKN